MGRWSGWSCNGKPYLGYLAQWSVVEQTDWRSLYELGLVVSSLAFTYKKGRWREKALLCCLAMHPSSEESSWGCISPVISLPKFLNLSYLPSCVIPSECPGSLSNVSSPIGTKELSEPGSWTVWGSSLVFFLLAWLLFLLLLLSKWNCHTRLYCFHSPIWGDWGRGRMGHLNQFALSGKYLILNLATECSSAAWWCEMVPLNDFVCEELGFQYLSKLPKESKDSFVCGFFLRDEGGSSQEDAVTAACGWYKTRCTEEMLTLMVTQLHEDGSSETSKCSMVGSRKE